MITTAEVQRIAAKLGLMPDVVDHDYALGCFLHFLAEAEEIADGWVFKGGKNNQFAFIDDSIGFSYQHAARSIGEGRLTLFDNGNMRAPQFSRAVEYAIDEGAKTATLVWEFRRVPSVFGFALGYVQRLPNGNTLIGWGSTAPAATEVRPDGEVVFELSMPAGMFSYRAFRFPWSGPVLSVEDADLPARPFLAQNYPNPFNGWTAFEFSLPLRAAAELRVFDVLGSVVAVLASGPLDAGEHRISWDASSLPSGVYLYRLQAGGATTTKKLLLLR